MKHVLLIFFLLCSNVIHTYTYESPKVQSQTEVYICITGEVYHSTRNCRGLNSAKHKVIKVLKEDAIKKYKRRPCKICY